MTRYVGMLASLMLAGCTFPGTEDRGGTDGGSRPSFFSSMGSDKEEWEIVCGRYEGPDRMRTADDLGAALKRVPQLDPKRVRVVHAERESRITYGPYLLGYNERGTVVFTRDIQRDVDLIRRLSVNEQFPFFTAVKSPAPTPDVGPRELDLRHARGVYSLQIGCFYNTPTFRQRKEAAVEWVRDLRIRGHEAYFFHGPKMSLVTVGAFDDSAYIAHKVKDRRAEVVVPHGPTRDYSKEVATLMQNPEFAYNHVNAAVEKVDGIPQPSFLVPIPRSDEGADRSGGRS